MKRRRVTYRPGKAQGVFGVIWGGIFVLIGLAMVVPVFGPFGILWTLAALGITVMNGLHAFGKKYVGPEIRIEDEEDGGWVLDSAAEHLERIREKRLPVEKINVYNHMAVFLRWCMEQDLMSLEFLERCWDAVEEFRADPPGTDLRPLIRDVLGGQLFSALFDEEGEAFARYYYNPSRGGDGPSFARDLGACALQRFGLARDPSGTFRDAYLFLPFDEDYYQAMARILERRFQDWQDQGR